MASQQLLADWLEQAHVFGAPDGQPVQRVVLNHGGHGRERLAELAQDELLLRLLLRRHVALDAHVHEPAGRPEMMSGSYDEVLPALFLT